MNPAIAHMFHRTWLCVGLWALVSSCASGVEKAPAEGWISLFNGRDLTGWRPKIAGRELDDNYKNTFRAENGVLAVSYDEYERFTGEFGHIFHRQPFSNYRFRAEYRFLGGQVPGGPGWAFRNSGVMIHCQAPESMGRDQAFPVCIEVQLLGGDGTNPRPTGNLCTPGTHVVLNGKLDKRHCIESASETYHGDRWVKVEIEVRGDSIKHFINGEQVMEYSGPVLDENDAEAAKLIKDGKKALTGGYISLQAESHPVQFRNIEILPL